MSVELSILNENECILYNLRYLVGLKIIQLLHTADCCYLFPIHVIDNACLRTSEIRKPAFCCDSLRIAYILPYRRQIRADSNKPQPHNRQQYDKDN